MALGLCLGFSAGLLCLPLLTAARQESWMILELEEQPTSNLNHLACARSAEVFAVRLSARLRSAIAFGVGTNWPPYDVSDLSRQGPPPKPF